jgi:serine/threonine-protein kinase HipA
MKILYTFYEQQLVGRLSQDEDLVFHFEYDDAWRTNPNAFALSLAMPLHQKSFGNRLSLSFFENLLPEGTIKDVIERHQNISGVIEFLDKFGRDCAGAIVLSSQPEGIPNLDPSQMLELDIAKVYEAIDAKVRVICLSQVLRTNLQRFIRRGVFFFRRKAGRQRTSSNLQSSIQESRNPYTMNTTAWSWHES